jgi:hypothetical protein
MNFNAKSTLAQVLEFGGAEEILAKYSVPCLGCPMAQTEMQELTIGQICKSYGIDEASLLKDLNELKKKFTKNRPPDST